MIDWAPPSLLPIVALALALAAGVGWRGRGRLPVAGFGIALAAWAVAVGAAAHPATTAWGTPLLMVGFFVPATQLHCVADELGASRLGPSLAYGLAAAMTLSSFVWPDLYLLDGGRQAGPGFLPMFALTCAMGVAPLLWLMVAPGDAGRAETRRPLMLASLAATVGGAAHILLTLQGGGWPIGLYLMLSAIGPMAYVALATELPRGRFAERSLRYTVLAAWLSALWMLGLLALIQLPGDGGWSLEQVALLVLLTLTAQPLLTELRSRLAGAVVAGDDAEGLTRALAHSEARAEHVERLAEIGRLTSAVAHEVRNPLGIIAASARVLELEGVAPERLEEIRRAVERAERFSSDLLDYGRPEPVRSHPVDLADVVQVAASDTAQALGAVGLGPLEVQVTGSATVHADAVQLAAAVGALLENAVLAGAEAVAVQVVTEADRVVLTLHDDGPGVPEPLQSTLFEPFVTGRGRDGPRPGTGLGLAIARGIAERHHGTLQLAPSDRGARFVLSLPAPPEAP